jgi:hypothetical protein
LALLVRADSDIFARQLEFNISVRNRSVSTNGFAPLHPVGGIQTNANRKK